MLQGWFLGSQAQWVRAWQPLPWIKSTNKNGERRWTDRPKTLERVWPKEGKDCWRCSHIIIWYKVSYRPSSSDRPVTLSVLQGVVGGVTGIVTKPVEGKCASSSFTVFFLGFRDDQSIMVYYLISGPPQIITWSLSSDLRSVTVVMLISAGAKKEGAAGFFKGIGKGLVGVVARPTGGIVDMASSTFQGIQRWWPHTFLNREDFVCCACPSCLCNSVLTNFLLLFFFVASFVVSVCHTDIMKCQRWRWFVWQ